MRRSRILIASEYFPPHWTGLAKSIYWFAKSLAKEHSVTVITTRFDPATPLEELVDGLYVLRVPYLLPLSRSDYSPQSLLVFWKRVKNFDTVVINSPHSNILPMSLMAKAFGKELRIFHQGDLILPRFERSPIKKWAFERAFDVMTIPSMAIADKLLTYTEDYARHSRVLRPFLKKVKISIPPIPSPPRKTDGAVAHRLAVLRGSFRLVGFSGRFVEEKGFDILLGAIPKVVEAIPNVKFVFAGETRMKYEKFFDEHQQKIRELDSYLEWLGLLGSESIWEFYRGLDVFVLSSRSDCFALTQAEAALCGVPVVVTDIPGARVMVMTTRFGEVVESENSPALARGIVNVLTHRADYLEKQNAVTRFLRENERGL